MTNEGQGQSPDESHVPPASTRWSRDPIEDDGGLAPPFVPGSGSPPERSSRTQDTEGGDPGPQDTMEPDPTDAEMAGFTETSPADREDDGLFPFETPWEGDETEPADEATARSDAGDSWPGGALGGAAGPGTAFPETPYEEPTDDFAGGAEAEEGGWEPGGASRDPAAELADRLETLARELRERGPEAVRSRMGSDDRFEALLSGLLAGWLTGRE